MKEKLTNNLGLKILSVILATILWLVITNIDNPNVTRRITNVPVTTLNEEAITAVGQVYNIVSGETIDFTVAGKRSVIDNLTKEDFRVIADFKKLSIVGSVILDIKIPRHSDEVTIVEGMYQTMQVTLEDLMEERFKVNVIEKGVVAGGYYIGEKIASPNILKVSGPKSRVARIKEVIVEVDVDGASTSFHRSVKPRVLDADGKEIDSKIKLSDDLVDVSINLYKTKTINLQITATGEPAYGYSKRNVDFEPKTIMIAGDDEALKDIKYLPINISVTGAFENIEKQINLQERLPEGIILVGEDKTVAVTIHIEKMESREISILPSDINMRNIPNNREVTFNTSGPITVSIMGPTEDIVGITKYSLNPYIDLTGLRGGTYVKEIKFNLPNTISIINNPQIGFKVSS